MPPRGFITNTTYTFSDYYETGLDTNTLSWTNETIATNPIYSSSVVVGTCYVHRVESGTVVNPTLYGSDLFDYDVAMSLRERIAVIGGNPDSASFYYRYDHGRSYANVVGAKQTVVDLAPNFIDMNSQTLDALTASNLLDRYSFPTNYLAFTYNKIHFNPFPPRYRVDTNSVFIIPQSGQAGPVYTNYLANPDGSVYMVSGTNGQRVVSTYTNASIQDGFTSDDYQATNLIQLINNLRYVKWSDSSTIVHYKKAYTYTSEDSESTFKQWWHGACGSKGEVSADSSADVLTNRYVYTFGGAREWSATTTRLSSISFKFIHTAEDSRDSYSRNGYFWYFARYHYGPIGLYTFIDEYEEKSDTRYESYFSEYCAGSVLKQTIDIPRGIVSCGVSNATMLGVTFWPGGYASNFPINTYSYSYYDYSTEQAPSGEYGQLYSQSTFSTNYPANTRQWLCESNVYCISKGPVIPLLFSASSVVAVATSGVQMVLNGAPDSGLSTVDYVAGYASYGFSFEGADYDHSCTFTRSASMSESTSKTISAAPAVDRSGSGFAFLDFAVPGGFTYY